MNAPGSGSTVHDERARSLAGLYDADYYAGYGGAPYRWGEAVWEEFFGRVADAIVAELAPKTVLDAGCGIGFLVDALRKRGVEAYGLDVSEYAISQVPEEIRPYCWVASVTEELDREYDLIVSLEVLEHLPTDLGELAVGNFARHTEQILFSSMPKEISDPSHLGVRPMEEWISLFARQGFFRNVDLDTSFIAPHAVHLVRSPDTAVAVAREYERWHWGHREELLRLQQEAVRSAAELQQLREEAEWWREEAQVAAAELTEWEAFRGRSGYRILLRLAQFRLQLAPRGTARDRVVRRTLRGVADLADRRGARFRRSAPETFCAVLFVSDCPGDARRYRCNHQAAQLALAGGTADVADHAEVDYDEVLDRYSAFILHRVPWGRDVQRFLEQAHLREKPVLFDTDDLVFDPDAREHLAALSELTESERVLYVQSLRRFQRTMRASDGVLVSTEPLRKAAERFHERIEITYNAVSDEMTVQADAAVAARPQRDLHDADAVTIGYFSGTHTHNRDFLQAADAVLWALERYPNVVFLAVGALTLDARFDAYGERVRRLSLQPWQQLPGILVDTDVNLAPLEPRNPFTECKSCLKYIEAGLVGTPTIASPRSDFVRAIEHGRNGLLADSPEEWQAAIQELVESPERRRMLGRAAVEDIRRNHTVRARSRELVKSVAALAGAGGAGALTINWVVHELSSDGERTILGLADHLGAQGHVVRVYMDADGNGRRVEPGRFEVHAGHNAIAPADATIATDAPTARVVAAHDRSLFKLYFVQTLESEAAEPYDLPLRHVCYGLELADELRARTGYHADAIEISGEPGEQLERILRETCFVRLRAP